MKRFVVFIVLILGIVGWGCTKYESETNNLKDSLERNVSDITGALSYISTTLGYQMLSASSSAYKCEELVSDSIKLDLIAGIYDFKPDLVHYHMFFIPYRLFEKTAESEQMVVNMPHKLVFHPDYLHNINPFDTLLENNFTISVSDYHCYFSLDSKYDYKLTGDFTLDSSDIGNIDITTAEDPESGFSYSSEYTFDENFKISVGFLSGDSTVSSFALKRDDEILMSETMTRVWKDSNEKEVKYVLSIGNIDIVRATGSDGIEVYLDGTLQQNTGAVIYDTIHQGMSILYARDILLTFNDGTTAKLSEMLKPAKKALAIIVDSLHSMNFATFVVNYIAASIYYHC